MIVLRSPRQVYFQSSGLCHPYAGVRFVHCHSNESPSNEAEAEATDSNKTNDKEHNKEEEPVPAYLIRRIHGDESEDAYSLLLELPGVKEQDVSVTEHDHTISVEATRKRGDKAVAKFHRDFSLDKKLADTEKTKATLSDGILTLVVPKKAEPETHSVTPVASDAPEKTEDTAHFSLEIPGVKAKDIDIEVKDDKFSLTAKRNLGASTKTINRSFALDEEKLDLSETEAYLMDGILTLVIPKKEEAPSVIRSIPVNDNLSLDTTADAKEEEEHDEAEIVVETVEAEEEDAENWEEVKESKEEED